MNRTQRFYLTLLRLALGVLFLYAGYSHVTDPTWTAAGYLNSAKTFAGFYHWLASPGVIGTVNFINKWGLTLLGISLILGVGVRLSARLGAIQMFLFYLPILSFPYIAPHSFLVDEHIVYAAALLVLASFRAGKVNGLGAKCHTWSICKRYPKLHKFLD